MKYKQANAENKTAQFWLYEEPEVMSTGKNTLRYYPKAQRLVVHLQYYIDYNGDRKPGKGTGLNLEALAEDQETLNWVLDILSNLVEE